MKFSINHRLSFVYIIFYKHIPEAVRNVDEKLFDFPIHVLMSIIILVAMFLYGVLDFSMRKFETTEKINLKMISKTNKPFLIFCLLLYLSCVMPLFWKRFQVNQNKKKQAMRNKVSFKTRTFCTMNQEEKICRPFQAEVSCFEKIPNRFEFDGRIDGKSCSLVFPPGYSIYVEEFILNDPGPDNFVLIDGNFLEYRSKLKWEDRGNTFWKKLHQNNPLYKKSTQRSNFPCVAKLKVTLY